MATMADLVRAKDICTDRLLNRALNSEVMFRTATMRVSNAVETAGTSVHAVGIGRKMTAGKPTNEMCVRFYVVQKLAKSLLPPRDLLPELIDGIPTDVIESPPAFIQAKKKPGVNVAAAGAATQASTDQRQSRLRPLSAGVGVAHRNVTVGTIAYFCRSMRQGDPAGMTFLLSNNHVLADVNQGVAGDDVYQPGPADGGAFEDHCADLRRFVPIRLGGVENNQVDCAIASIRATTEHILEICAIGKIAGVEAAVDGLPVRKHGRTSGYSEGTITDVHYTGLVGMDHNDPSVVARFKDQIRIETAPTFTAFALGGDSGSLIVARDRLNAVGLYFAGPDIGTYGVANPIGKVLEELEIELLI